ncbi:MAG: hypothetical protein WC205_12360 [Opitutaceae bacterium]|jgi:hypothetical protein
MRLFADIRSKWLLHAKGFLFLLVGLLAVGALLLDSPTLRTLFLLLITIWAFCRFYYYLFYVLEHYIGRDQKYAGIWDALKFIIGPKNRR